MGIKLQKLKTFFIKLPRKLAEKTFVGFWVFFFLALIIGLVVFYKYSILTMGAEPEAPVVRTQFREKIYQKVLKAWQEQDEKLEAADSKEYPDLFNLD